MSENIDLKTIEFFESFIKEKESEHIITKYNDHKKNFEEKGLNIFHIISDIYYRENLHSDIIKFLLSKDETHNANNVYLKIFIDLLNKNINLNNKKSINKIETIDFNYYTDSLVTRETERIDILIKTKSEEKGKKRAIIIENKINNAQDTPRQLPNYFDKIRKEGFEVDAIVYLSLDGNKRPQMYSLEKEKQWTDNERKEIKEKLIFLAAFTGNENDLYNGWIKPCIYETNDYESLFFIKQYQKLIKNLGGYFMNMQIMEKLYELLMKNNNYTNIINIKELLEKDFPTYLAYKIKKDFDKNPYETPFNEDPIIINEKIIDEVTMVVFKEWNYKEKYRFRLTIHFDLNSNKYEVRFFDCEDNESYGELDEFFNKDFSKGVEGFYKYFNFPVEEDKLYLFIRELMKKLVEFK